MAWRAYTIVLRLRAPLHVGRGKVGNLQRTRRYVTGRNLWGALTARLARNSHSDGRPKPATYTEVGERVHEELAFTYLFATTQRNGRIKTWPWDPRFRYRFLSTYAGTALDYASTSAEEKSLHEVECITPHTRDDGKPVYLTGYLFQAEASGLKWQQALEHLQIGGERGYGWGRVMVEAITEIQSHLVDLFSIGHTADLQGDVVRVDLAAGQPLLAHALAADFVGNARHPALACDIRGPVEPLVGRETTSAGRFGGCVSHARICHAPGAEVDASGQVVVGPYGVWESG
jgi:hypothetical protein